ncbi:hypothetical protein LTR65_000272 [Meristemomyces frigidus]
MSSPVLHGKLDDGGHKGMDVGVSSTASDTPSTVSQEQLDRVKAVRRKVDVKILLWYSFVYLVMRINVSNISNTAIMNLEQGHGIKKQLGKLSSAQWAWVLSIFYYPYMVFEPASTLLLKRFRPRVWMSRIMITWGIISICQAATQNYGGILAARFFLGLAEAGFYPGVLYHLSFWYPADKMPLRIAFFYACGQFSGTISGLLAYAISFLDGAGGLSVFIIEGIPAVLCGIYTLFFLPNYPEDSKFLDAEETQVLLDDLPKTQPSSTAKTWNLSQAKALFQDPTYITFTLIWVFHSIGGWGVSTVLPTVIADLGLTGTAVAQLMTMPTYAFGCTCLVGIGWLIHTKKVTPWVAAITLEVIAMVCYIILISVKNTIVKYIFVTLATACSICIYPILWPERIRAARGTTTAGLAIGLTNAAAQFSGIVGPQVYQSKFGPTYRISYSVSLALLAAAIASIVATWILVKKRDAQPSQHASLQDVLSSVGATEDKVQAGHI